MVGLLNDARQILLRPTPVAMATKFGAKSAITRLVKEIPEKSSRITRGFLGQSINDASQILLRPTPVAIATK